MASMVASVESFHHNGHGSVCNADAAASRIDATRTEKRRFSTDINGRQKLATKSSASPTSAQKFLHTHAPMLGRTAADVVVVVVV